MITLTTWNTNLILGSMINKNCLIWANSLLLFACVLTFVGCGTNSTKTTTVTPSGSVSTSPAITTVQPISDSTNATITTLASVATGTVLDLVTTDATKRTQYANEIWGAANGLNSLLTGTIPSVQTLQATILAFGGTSNDANYAQFATSVTSIYSLYYAKYVTNGAAANSVTTANVLAVISDIAKGLQQGSGAYETIAAQAAN